MKIIKLESENIKRLHAVEIKPDGSLVIIGGENEQGKSSVIDSIEYLFADKSHLPDEPIHRGKKEGKIIGETEEFIIKKVITGSRKTNDLKVKAVITNKQNFPVQGSPQMILDNFYKVLTFDPLAFSRMDSKKQLETLKNLVGIDFSKLDEEKKKIYDDRTLVNRDIKSLQAQVEAIEEYKDVPEEEVLITDLLGKQEIMVEHNKQNEQKRYEMKSIVHDIEISEKNLEVLKEEIKKLRQKWDNAIKENEELKKTLSLVIAEVDVLQDIDTDPIHTQISQAEEINSKIRSNNKRNELQFNLELRQQQSEKISKRLEEIESEKEKIISSSKLPITGLSFDENGVTFNNLPLDQSSSAELLLVSASIGLSLNPKLRILLLRDGSLLDKKHLKLLAKWAEDNEAQVWLETVSEGRECQVIIEDGRVK